MFIDGGVDDTPRGPMPILSGSWSDPLVTYDDVLMYSDSRTHDLALASITDMWNARRHEIALRAGDVLFVDNTRVIHGRARSTIDDTEWLFRFQVAKSLSQSRFARNGNSSIIEATGC
jgi:L-asparagine oxygenase